MGGALAVPPRSLQDLPPHWAHFCLHVEQFIVDELAFDLARKTLIVACSGGADSTALLLVLHWLAGKNNGRVVAVHLDHGLRAESGDDAAFVCALCADLGIECVVREADVAALARRDGVGLEEAGRTARYALFAEVLDAERADGVAVAHHLDDLAEDVLLRLIRGTGWPGLSGMAGFDPRRRLLRPFLLTPKAELTRLLADLGMDWREDCSNRDERWRRNRIRHTLLPLILAENPNFLESVARLWRVGGADAGYWESLTEDAGDFLPAARLAAAPRALRLRLYKAALDALGSGQVLADTLFGLDAAWAEGRIGAVFQFPGGRTARITTSGVLFSAGH